MVRVSLKNTFLSVDEDGSGDDSDAGTNARAASPFARPFKAASPRSRSADYHQPATTRHMSDEFAGGQIEKLNRMLSPVPSPTVSSPRSPVGHSPGRIDVEQSSAMPPNGEICFHMEVVSSDSDHNGGTPPSGSEESRPGPSAQELKQLQRRLEELCWPRAHNGQRDGDDAIVAALSLCKHQARMPHVASSGSVSTLGMDDGSAAEDATAAVSAKMYNVSSSNSISTMASEHAAEYRQRCSSLGSVEFDLTIEENPDVQRRVLPTSQQPCPQRHMAPLVGRQTPEQMSAPHMAPRAVAAGPMYPQHAEQSMVKQASLAKQTSTPPSAPCRSVQRECRHGRVPKNLDLQREYKKAQGNPPTTIMIRNIPNRYTQRELIMELEDLGFGGSFDFLYIPLDKGTMSNVGYAFVNFLEPIEAENCMAAFQNYRFKRHRKISGKIAAVSVAHIQGLEANLAHYEKAAINTAKLKQRRPVVIANISQTLAAALDMNSN